MPSPGGWPLLGRTPVRVLDLHSDPITAYRPGDTFRFRPIEAQQWDAYADLSLADLVDAADTVGVADLVDAADLAPMTDLAVRHG
jgi:hypothetical protein